MPDRTAESLILKMWDPFGTRLDVATDQILRIMIQKRTAGFILLAVVAFVTFDALALRDQLSLLSAAVIWSVIVPLQLVLYIAMDIVWALGQRRFGLGRIYVPVLGLLAYSINTVFFAGMLALLSGQGFTASYDPQLILLGYPLALIFELLFFAFVLPTLMLRAGVKSSRYDAPGQSPLDPPDPLASTSADDPAGAPIGAPRCIRVAGQAFDIDSLVLVRSDEHHVEVVTDTERHRLRARLIDLVTQTEPADGILAHRSYWIARRAIAGFDTGKGPQAANLILTDASILPVARPRRAAVLEWLAQHRPDVLAVEPSETSAP